MIPEAAYAMLACARIGAIQYVVFGGFSTESLKDRILDADCCIVITADEDIRGGKNIPLRDTVDSTWLECLDESHCMVIKRPNGSINWVADRDRKYE